MKEKKINTAEYIKTIKEGPEKKRSYMFFGFSIVATALLIVFAVRPTITTITRINQEIKQKSRTSELLEKKINALSQLDREYESNTQSFKYLELIFPADNNYSLLLANIEAIVARNGYVLSSVGFDSYRGDDYNLNTRVLVPQTMSFSVRGRRANLIKLLRELEDLPMYPVVEALSYSTQEGTDGLNSFTITLRIYNIEIDKFYK
jgi:hypothetical protein